MKLTLVILDNEPVVGETLIDDLSFALKEHGHDVDGYVVPNLKNFLILLETRQIHPDCVLVDIDLDQEDGGEEGGYNVVLPKLLSMKREGQLPTHALFFLYSGKDKILTDLDEIREHNRGLVFGTLPKDEIHKGALALQLRKLIDDGSFDAREEPDPK